MGDRRRTGAERTSWVHPTRPTRDGPREEFRDATWSCAPRLGTLQLMSGRAQKVLGEALDLTDEERAEVALELVASLDGPRDADAEDAWVTEIERRARRALSDPNSGEDWTSARAEIESKLRRS